MDKKKRGSLNRAMEIMKEKEIKNKRKEEVNIKIKHSRLDREIEEKYYSIMDKL
jgi:hypothetical protein